MSIELTKEEVWVREELSKLYPQLVINCKKTLGAAYEKHGGDLLAVCIEFFLNKPIEVQVEAFKNNKAENFITFMMGMQSKSGSSKFFNQYRRWHESQREYFTDHYEYDSDEPDDFELDDLALCIKKAQSKLDPYETMLINERVIKGEKFVDIAEQYNIPYSSLASELKKVLKKIKKECQHLR